MTVFWAAHLMPRVPLSRAALMRRAMATPRRGARSRTQAAMTRNGGQLLKRGVRHGSIRLGHLLARGGRTVVSKGKCNSSRSQLRSRATTLMSASATRRKRWSLGNTMEKSTNSLGVRVAVIEIGTITPFTGEQTPAIAYVASSVPAVQQTGCWKNVTICTAMGTHDIGG